MIKTLSIDLETYSDVDIAKCGVYKYATSPNFEILLFGYSIDGGEVQVVDLAQGEKIPEVILEMIADDDVLKTAFNAVFERVCLSTYLHRFHPELIKSRYLSPYSWRCTMVWAAYCGYPLSLKEAGAAMGLERQKLEEGKELIRYFCVPCKPTKSNGGRTRNLPEHAKEKWSLFKSYNKRDVEVELQIQDKLSFNQVPESVWDEYHIDQEINDRGILVDMEMVENAIALDKRTRDELVSTMQKITELENPNSVQQLRDWLGKSGAEMESLGKKNVAAILPNTEGDVKKVLQLRQQLAKSSVKKYLAMENAAGDDNRARGMFQFYGANRTGRFSGRLVQLQNLPQNHLQDLDEARALVKDRNFEAMELLYDDIPDTLSQLIRTAFIPAPGYRYYVADFSAIEARVLSYLAGEQWRMDVFEKGGDIYCATASKMFGVPVVKHGENGELRQKGKQAELACIAEGSLVLTDNGLIPIERVTTLMKVWDGESWVEHEGVVFRGEKEVISYEGLTATPDHLVFTEDLSYPVEFQYAIKEGLKLERTEEWNGDKFPYKGIAMVYDIKNAGPNHRFVVSGVLVHNCGYGGGVGAMIAMGAIEAGMKEEELQPLVDAWRQASPNIVRFWWNVDSMIKKAIKEQTTTKLGNISFEYAGSHLFIQLPSGRKLSYVAPRIGVNKFGGESIQYMGVGATKKWELLESYGPKFVENIVQGVSRDILCHAMKNLRNERIVAHVHDELIIECTPDTKLEDICEKMGSTPPWVEGLCLRADGFVSDYYKKD